MKPVLKFSDLSYNTNIEERSWSSYKLRLGDLQDSVTSVPLIFNKKDITALRIGDNSQVISPFVQSKISWCGEKGGPQFFMKFASEFNVLLCKPASQYVPFPILFGSALILCLMFKYREIFCTNNYSLWIFITCLDFN